MDHLWSRIRIFQFLGLCALDFGKDGNLKPMPILKFFIKLTLSTTLVIVFFLSGYVFATFEQTNLGILDIRESQTSFYKSTTDSLTLSGSIFVTFLSAILLVIENFKMSRVLPEYWRDLLLNSSFDIEARAKISSTSFKWVVR